MRRHGHGDHEGDAGVRPASATRRMPASRHPSKRASPAWRQPCPAAEHAQHQALGQHLRDGRRRERRAPSARPVPRPRGAGREQQVGQVGAGNQRHRADGAAEQQQAARSAATASCSDDTWTPSAWLPAGPRLRAAPPAWPVRRAGPASPRARVAPPPDEVAAAIRFQAIELVGHEDIGRAVGVLLDMTEPCRQHADDRRRPGVDEHLGADHARVTGEAPLPVTVTQQDHEGRARAVVVRRDAATERRFDAECREEAVGDVDAADAVGVTRPAGHGERPDVAVGAHAGEGAGVAREVEEVRRREIARRLLVEVEAPHLGQRVGLGKGQRPQQHALQEREHRRVGANPERQRADGHGREPGPLRQSPQREAYGRHVPSLTGLGRARRAKGWGARAAGSEPPVEAEQREEPLLVELLPAAVPLAASCGG